MSQAGIINIAGGGGGGSPIETLTGNNPVAVPPTLNNINIVGTGAVNVSGNAATSTLTISVSDIGFVWTDQAVSFPAEASNGYFVTATATATLPAGAAQGDTVAFVVDVAAPSKLTILANAAQRIRSSNMQTALAGTAVNTQQGDTMTLVFRAVDSTWMATSAAGAWTIT